MGEAANNGRVLVVERLVGSDRRAGLPLLANDLEMMVNVGGRERSEAEMHALFAEAGLYVRRVISGASSAGHAIVEGCAR